MFGLRTLKSNESDWEYPYQGHSSEDQVKRIASKWYTHLNEDSLPITIQVYEQKDYKVTPVLETVRNNLNNGKRFKWVKQG